MKCTLKTFLTVIAGAILLTTHVAQAKEEPPKPEKMQKLSFPKFTEFTTKNGLEVVVVEHHEQPVATIYLVLKTGSALDPKGKESLASFVVDQLNKGTTSRSAVDLAEWIESVGGSVNTFAEEDHVGVSISILSEYLNTAYAYLEDILLDPSFPEDELETLRKRVKTALEIELSNPGAMARRHLRTLIYGNHPYSKQPTVESVEAIARKDLVDFHGTNFVADNALMAVVGDVKSKDVKKAVDKHFGGWKRGTPAQAVFANPPTVDRTRIYLYHKPGAVQTEIYVGHIGIRPNNPDWPAVTVANRILGGGADARLFMNLREQRGWTYGAYSSFDRKKDLGYFEARAAVRTEVTDSAHVELMKELARITSEPVSAEDLDNAKSYLIGNFPLKIETPEQIAMQIGEVKLLGLGKEELETYRERLGKVKIEDVNRVMKQYLKPDRAYAVMVGDATEIKDKLETIAEVSLFDIEGNRLSLEEMAVAPSDYLYNTAVLNDMSATYALSVREMQIGDVQVVLKKKKSGGKQIIEVSSNMDAMMVKMEEKMELGGSDLSPISFKRSMTMGPSTSNTELAFAGGSGSGTIQAANSPEPKQVTFELVDGTIIDGALEYAIGCLPLEVKKKFRFPVVDSDSGTLLNVAAEVVAEVEVQTPAGQFTTFKVKVKSPKGEGYFYIDKTRPGVLVKTEMPAQAMTMELKNLAN